MGGRLVSGWVSEQKQTNLNKKIPCQNSVPDKRSLSSLWNSTLSQASCTMLGITWYKRRILSPLKCVRKLSVKSFLITFCLFSSGKKCMILIQPSTSLWSQTAKENTQNERGVRVALLTTLVRSPSPSPSPHIHRGSSEKTSTPPIHISAPSWVTRVSTTVAVYFKG